jgi:hypothetical protein
MHESAEERVKASHVALASQKIRALGNAAARVKRSG